MQPIAFSKCADVMEAGVHLKINVGSLVKIGIGTYNMCAEYCWQCRVNILLSNFINAFKHQVHEIVALCLLCHFAKTLSTPAKQARARMSDCPIPMGTQREHADQVARRGRGQGG